MGIHEERKIINQQSTSNLHNSSHFDYIIIGAGAAGLMLAHAMSKDSFFTDKSVLLLDKDLKKTNDRTWCFWEKEEGQFNSIVHEKWDYIYFGGKNFSQKIKINPYSYKMVRGIDFYTSYFGEINSSPNVTFQPEMVTQVVQSSKQAIVVTHNSTYTAQQVFNSIFDYKMVTHQKKYPVLQQHFLGWVIKTSLPTFDVNQVTYMDFSIPQKGNTRFMYVLPTSTNQALIEYTLFSEDLLPKVAYENAIKDYLHTNLGCTDYEIVETETGSIPMTTYDFTAHNTPNIFNIGTAGGWAKPSTGYTFMSTAQKTPMLIEHLKKGKPLNQLNFKNRFRFYDMLFLDVLYKDNANGNYIFETLFKNRSAQLIFKFLDEQTNIYEDFKYILGCPKKPFVKALLKRFFIRFFA